MQPVPPRGPPSTQPPLLPHGPPWRAAACELAGREGKKNTACERVRWRKNAVRKRRNKMEREKEDRGEIKREKIEREREKERVLWRFYSFQQQEKFYQKSFYKK